MPAASGWITARLRSSLWIFRIVSRRCLRFISCQWSSVGWLLVFLFFSSGLGFMLTFHVKFNLARPGRRKLLNLPSGVEPFSFYRTTPATIYTIAITGAMLLIGQERSREKAALAAEPGCASDFSWATP